VTALAGIALIIAGGWFDAAHKHHLTGDAKTISIGAIVLGGMLFVAWLGGLMRF
jgi:hypothetical protein